MLAFSAEVVLKSTKIPYLYNLIGNRAPPQRAAMKESLGLFVGKLKGIKRLHYYAEGLRGRNEAPQSYFYFKEKKKKHSAFFCFSQHVLS